MAALLSCGIGTSSEEDLPSFGCWDCASCSRDGQDCVVKIASCPRDFEGAFRLVYQAYLERGLTTPNPFEMRVTRFHLLPRTEVFVAVKEGDVICTMTLIPDTGRGHLPMEAIYKDEVRSRRKAGVRLAEVSCLADRRKGLERTLPILFRVINLMGQSAVRRGIDQLVIVVHPRHAAFYEGFLGFQRIGEEKVYPAVRNNPAVALTLDLHRLASRNRRAYRRFFGSPFPEQELRYRPVPDDILEKITLIAGHHRHREAALCPASEMLIAGELCV